MLREWYLFAGFLTDYQYTQPNFTIEAFFSGPMRAYSIIQDRSGKVTRRFSTELIGTWQGNQGVLAEVFQFDDGETQERTWHITKQADGSYTGTASDVVGEAKGGTKGFVLNWHYTLEITVDGTLWEINLDDWMFLIDDKRLINKAEMSKFGITVGEITLFIEKSLSLFW